MIPLLTKLGGRKLLAALSVVLIAVSYFVSVHYTHVVYSGESGQWVNSWFQFQFFAAGALLAIMLHGRVPRWPVVFRIAMFFAALGCWVLAVMKTGVKSYDLHPTVAGAIGGWTLVLIGSVILFLAALGTPQKFVPHWLTYLGRISFGLYMFHSVVFHLTFTYLRPQFDRVLSATVVTWLCLALVMTASIVLAAGSYRYFERPFLKVKEKFTFVRSRPE